MAKDTKKAIEELRRFMGTEKDKFVVGEREYTVLPFLARVAIELIDSGYPILSPAGVLLPDWRNKTDEYLKMAVRDKESNPVDLKRALADDWTVDDICECLKRAARLSG